MKFDFHLFSHFHNRIYLHVSTVLTLELLVQKQWLVYCWHLGMHQSIGTKLCPKPFWSSLINDILGEIWKFTNFLESWPLSRCLCSIFWDESEPKSTSAVRVGCLSPMKSTCALSFMLTQLLLHRKPFLLFEWLSYSDLLFGWLFFFFENEGRKPVPSRNAADSICFQ